MRYLKQLHILIASFFLLFSCEQPMDKRQNQSDTSRSVHEQPEDALKSYENDQYNIKVQYPPDWKVHEREEGIPVITIYNPEQIKKDDLPLSIHSRGELSHVSFFPKGLGTELPSGRLKAVKDAPHDIPVSFQIDSSESRIFMLEGGEVWGYFLRPSGTSEGWQEGGFIFAQIGADSIQMVCFDNSGGKKAMDQCDPLMGDQIVRKGKIKEADRKKIEAVLGSVRLALEQEADQTERPVSDLIHVESPEANDSVSFPLTIKGEARGYWYFEGSFPVFLRDEAGNTLSQTSAQAQGEWMTEDFTPFQATLNYTGSSDNKKAYLVFERSNPSGLPEHDRSYRHPVLLKSGKK